MKENAEGICPPHALPVLGSSIMFDGVFPEIPGHEQTCLFNITGEGHPFEEVRMKSIFFVCFSCVPLYTLDGEKIVIGMLACWKSL